MPEKTVVVDYQKCHPEKCDHGVCIPVLECDYGILVQESIYEAPEINPARWCHGCGKCTETCPLKAIRVL